MSRLDLAIGEITSARDYTCALLDTVKPDDWFRRPSEGVTHIAWQVGHLAMAEYRLAIEKTCGKQDDEAELISQDFLSLFGRNSVPDPDPQKNPTPDELRKVFDRVHRRTLEVLPTLANDELDKPPLSPHRLFNTKLGSLFWCSRHEMLHAGQIGLLRRLLGHDPAW